MPVPTPFHERTVALCTSYRFKEWAGHVAVCSYDSNHEAEYLAFRNAAGLLDVSPLKKYDLTGPGAVDLLSFVATRDVGRLAVGRVGYTCFCDVDGKVIDDGTVARLDEDRFRMTSASPMLWWLLRHARGHDVEIVDTSESLAALAIQGPMSRGVLASASDADVEDLRFFGITSARIDDIDVDISRTGYTGDLGYEVWVAAQDAVRLWDALTAAGQDFGLQPAGLDALDMTRVEAGFVLQDVDYYSAPRCLIEARKSSPYELGLGWTVHLDRAPFVGQDALRQEVQDGSPWAFVGLEISWEEIERVYDEHGLPPALPRHAWRTPVPVYSGGRQVGQATSGTWSPVCKKNLALATVRSNVARTGTELKIEHTVEFARRHLTATVVERPFFDPPRKRA